MAGFSRDAETYTPEFDYSHKNIDQQQFSSIVIETPFQIPKYNSPQNSEVLNLDVFGITVPQTPQETTPNLSEIAMKNVMEFNKKVNETVITEEMLQRGLTDEELEIYTEQIRRKYKNSISEMNNNITSYEENLEKINEILNKISGDRTILESSKENNKFILLNELNLIIDIDNNKVNETLIETVENHESIANDYLKSFGWTLNDLKQKTKEELYEKAIEYQKKQYELLEKPILDKIHSYKGFEDYTYEDLLNKKQSYENDIALLTNCIQNIENSLSTLDYDMKVYNKDYKEYQKKYKDQVVPNIDSAIKPTQNEAAKYNGYYEEFYTFSYEKYIEKNPTSNITPLEFYKAAKERLKEMGKYNYSISIPPDFKKDDIETFIEMSNENPQYAEMFNYLYAEKSEKVALDYLKSKKNEINQFEGQQQALKEIAGLDLVVTEEMQQIEEKYKNLKKENKIEYDIQAVKELLDDIKKLDINNKEEVENLINNLDITDLENLDKNLQNIIDTANGSAKIANTLGNLLNVTGDGLSDGIYDFFEGIGKTFSQTNQLSAQDYKVMIYAAYLEQHSMAYDEVYSTSMAVGNMVPVITTTALLTALAPELTPAISKGISALGRGAMGLSTYGNTNTQLLSQGIDPIDAAAYSLLAAGSESLLEKYGGLVGISEMPGEKFITKMINEGKQEAVQELLQGIVGDGLILGQDIDLANLSKDTLNSFLTGILVAGCLNGYTNAINITINGLKIPLTVDEQKAIATKVDNGMDPKQAFEEVKKLKIENNTTIDSDIQSKEEQNTDIEKLSEDTVLEDKAEEQSTKNETQEQNTEVTPKKEELKDSANEEQVENKAKTTDTQNINKRENLTKYLDPKTIQSENSQEQIKDYIIKNIDSTIKETKFEELSPEIIQQAISEMAIANKVSEEIQIIALETDGFTLEDAQKVVDLKQKNNMTEQAAVAEIQIQNIIKENNVSREYATIMQKANVKTIDEFAMKNGMAGIDDIEQILKINKIREELNLGDKLTDDDDAVKKQAFEKIMGKLETYKDKKDYYINFVVSQQLLWQDGVTEFIASNMYDNANLKTGKRYYQLSAIERQAYIKSEDFQAKLKKLKEIELESYKENLIELRQSVAETTIKRIEELVESGCVQEGFTSEDILMAIVTDASQEIYLTEEYIKSYKEKWKADKDGKCKVVTFQSADEGVYNAKKLEGNLGRPEGMFVMPFEEYQQILADRTLFDESGKCINTAKLMQKLGGVKIGEQPVAIIQEVDINDIQLPDGSLYGAFIGDWMPGGLTQGGGIENGKVKLGAVEGVVKQNSLFTDDGTINKNVSLELLTESQKQAFYKGAAESKLQAAINNIFGTEKKGYKDAKGQTIETLNNLALAVKIAKIYDINPPKNVQTIVNEWTSQISEKIDIKDLKPDEILYIAANSLTLKKELPKLSEQQNLEYAKLMQKANVKTIEAFAAKNGLTGIEDINYIVKINNIREELGIKNDFLSWKDSEKKAAFEKIMTKLETYEERKEYYKAFVVNAQMSWTGGVNEYIASQIYEKKNTGKDFYELSAQDRQKYIDGEFQVELKKLPELDLKVYKDNLIDLREDVAQITIERIESLVEQGYVKDGFDANSILMAIVSNTPQEIYLTEEYIKNYKAKWNADKNGNCKVVTFQSADEGVYNARKLEGNLGRPEGMFVMPFEEYQKILKDETLFDDSGKCINTAKLMETLGGVKIGEQPVAIIQTVNINDIQLPDGSLDGAFLGDWMPGGYTQGGYDAQGNPLLGTAEGVIKQNSLFNADGTINENVSLELLTDSQKQDFYKGAAESKLNVALDNIYGAKNIDEKGQTAETLSALSLAINAVNIQNSDEYNQNIKIPENAQKIIDEWSGKIKGDSPGIILGKASIVLDITSRTSLNETEAIKLADIFTEGVDAASTKYNGFFKNFREHAEAHSLNVTEYALKIAEKLENVNLKEVEVAAMGHDLGMKGGLYAIENSNGTFSFKKIDEGFDLEKLTQEESSKIAGRARKNHPLNSALTLLTEDIVPDGIDKDIVAILAMSHSKSTSGVKHFSSKAEWKNCINKLSEALKQYNEYNGTNFEFNKEKMKKLLDDPKEFQRLQNEALAIRDGDAMSEIAYKQFGQEQAMVMQTGSTSRVTIANPRESFSNTVADSAKKELKSLGVKDIITLSDGTVKALNVEDSNEMFSMKIHVGEQNVKFKSKYDEMNYSAEITLVDSNNAPNCTFDAIEERIGEVVTYDNCENREFVIKLPQAAKDTKLGNWYVDKLESYKKQKTAEIIESYGDTLKQKNETLKQMEKIKSGIENKTLEEAQQELSKEKAKLEKIEEKLLHISNDIAFYKGDGTNGNIKVIFK